MGEKVPGCQRLAVGREIGRAAHDGCRHRFADTCGDHSRRQAVARPDPGVEASGDDVRQSTVFEHLGRDLRMAREKIGHVVASIRSAAAARRSAAANRPACR